MGMKVMTKPAMKLNMKHTTVNTMVNASLSLSLDRTKDHTTDHAIRNSAEKGSAKLTHLRAAEFHLKKIMVPNRYESALTARNHQKPPTATGRKVGGDGAGSDLLAIGCMLRVAKGETPDLSTCQTKSPRYEAASTRSSLRPQGGHLRQNRQ